LTGSKEEIKAIARKYRIYFRPAKTSSDNNDKSDYLVDHSIFFFLVDPEGHYVTHFGRESSPERCAKIITDALSSWDISN
jgi:protein SCO1/2